jgi:hypothetical protein
MLREITTLLTKMLTVVHALKFWYGYLEGSKYYSVTFSYHTSAQGDRSSGQVHSSV